jgi:type I restriction enzyme M protein
MGTMESTILRVLTENDITKIADTVQAWRSGEDYDDVAGFCKSASLEEIEKNGCVLTPGRYVGAVARDEDTEPFNHKMQRLKDELSRNHGNASKLDEQIGLILKVLNNE